MALTSSGAISVNDIRTEFGLTGAVSFNDLYRGTNGDGTIRDNYGENDGVPLSGALEFSDFYDLYREGDITDKLANFNTYHDGGLIYTRRQTGSVIVTHTGRISINNPNAHHVSSVYVENAQNKSTIKSVSEWTTIVGIAGMPGGSNRTDPIKHDTGNTGTYGTTGLTLDATQTINGNANVAVAYINKAINELGNTEYAFTRNTGRNWCMGGQILLPGKWEVDRQYSYQGTGWGINPHGITDNSHSVTLANDEIAVWARERAGDGHSEGYWTGTGVTYIEWAGFWYSTGNWGITWASDGVDGSHPIYNYKEQPDSTWVLKEAL